MKALALLVIIIVAALAGMLAGGAVSSATQGQPGVDAPALCAVWDISCQVSRTLSDMIVPFIFAILLFLVALFILPKLGKGGAALSLLVVSGLVLYYLGIPGVIPPLKSMF